MRKRAASFVFLLMIFAACAGNVDPARQIDDAVIAERIRAALDTDASLRGEPIEVSVDAGVVRLTGSVGSADEKSRAEAVARGVSGVTAVENLLSSR